MSKKLAVLIDALVTAVSGGAIALVSYFEPSNMAIVNSAIEVGSGAIITIINLFVTPALLKKADEKAEEKKAE
jgi:multisubunit Na+/H+ antiporter MnhB subunit